MLKSLILESLMLESLTLESITPESMMSCGSSGGIGSCGSRAMDGNKRAEGSRFLLRAETG
jgi:hypothetical protein